MSAGRNRIALYGGELDAGCEVARMHVYQTDLASHRLGDVSDAHLRREDRRPCAETIDDDVARDVTRLIWDFYNTKTGNMMKVRDVQG